MGFDRNDDDPQETLEWVHSLDSVVQARGLERARFVLSRLMERAREHGCPPDQLLSTPHVNTIPVDEQPAYPGDEELETRIGDIVRWNAAVMVSRANVAHPGIGGHISSFASSAELYSVAFDHFLRGPDAEGGGDQVYYQGHASPGIYARAFLEGRIGREQLERFRRETARTADRWHGLASYPHPRLMPDFWSFPTVSMGIGPIFSIYQARFNRYLAARGLKDTDRSRVWCFVGDGETDEPETLGALSVAAREGLDNLTWVVNCNLQRLDGPVRGNGNIVQELETVFRGAGWNVIKVLWGSEWDPLFAKDTQGLIARRMADAVDGEFQRFRAEDGAFIRRHFFGTSPELLELAAHLSDDDIWAMRRGGHDLQKLYTAYAAAAAHPGQPTVILAKTVKGFSLGEGFEATNATHQMKKMDRDALRSYRDRLELPIPDSDLDSADYYHPGPDSPEVRYLTERRAALGGSVPARRTTCSVRLELPPADLYDEFLAGGRRNREVSTTMAYVRLLGKLIKDERIGRRVVPIIPDEARTFGMEPLFRQVGIYSRLGQKYEPVDRKQLLYYRETADGQVLQEGINEAGSLSSFMAAGTSYATHDTPMIPFYTFYSMFGFQRIGDLAWAMADARCRGFLVGATAGRTTLNGEGLQHQDGHSHVLAATFPNVRAYDPAFAFEIALIVRDGLERMFERDEDVFVYLTVHNENRPHPPMPEGVERGVIEGLYPFQRAETRADRHVHLFGCGSIMWQVLAARDLLVERFGVSADVWGATSYQLLRNGALAAERWNRLHPETSPRTSWLQDTLAGESGPFVAASDSMKLVPDQIARWVPGTFVPLGTDGFGMSDTREALRRHFEVDAESIALACLHALAQDGVMDPADVAAAYETLEYDPEKLPPSAI